VIYRYPGESAGKEEADIALRTSRELRNSLKPLLG